MSDRIAHADDNSFDATVLQSEEPVLVDFWAPWCGPCKMIAPILDEVADSYAGKLKIVKVNTDVAQKIPRNLEIIPTTSLWFGVTYKEDAPFVEKSLNELIEQGEYPRSLW